LLVPAIYGRAPLNRLNIDVYKRQGFVFLEFSDNGDGIPKANRDRVFDAFFTTTGGSLARASDASQAVGTGLGLKIVADIVQSAGGQVEVVDPPEGYATTIRITVPAGSPDADGESEGEG